MYSYSHKNLFGALVASVAGVAALTLLVWFVAGLLGLQLALVPSLIVSVVLTVALVLSSGFVRRVP